MEVDINASYKVEYNTYAIELYELNGTSPDHIYL